MPRTRLQSLLHDRRNFLGTNVYGSLRSGGAQRDARRLAQLQARQLKLNRSRLARKLFTAMGSRPFVQKEQFGGVWRRYESTPFSSQQYDYELWIPSHFSQSRRSMLRELQRSQNFTVFGRAEALYFRYPGDAAEAADVERKHAELVAQYGPDVPVGAYAVMRSTHVPLKCVNHNSVITTAQDVHLWIALFMKHLRARCEATKDSRWQFWKGVHFDFQYSQYTPFAGASHVKLPGFLSKKAALVNVQNRDDRCMEYALICGLHYHELGNTKNAERVRQTQTYPPWMQPYVGALDFEGVDFPVTTDGKAFARIERLNNLTINVFALKDEDCTKEGFKSNLFRLYKSPHKDWGIPIFYFKGHYMFIHDWKAFTNRQGEHKFHCPNCMLSRTSQHLLDEHIKECDSQDPMNTQMPPEHSCITFNKWHHTKRHPVGVYCDFEAFNHAAQPQGVREGGVMDLTRGDKATPKDVCSEQTASSCGFHISCDIPLTIESFHSVCKMCEEDDAHAMAVQKIREIEEVVRREVFDTEKPQPALTAEQRRAFDASTRCPHCKHRYGSRRWSKAEEAMVAVEKVEDHDHRTGAFRSDLCNECNLTLGKLEKRQSRFVNFYFHNLKGYDMHHIIQALASDDTEFERMSCIPQNNEKLTTFSWRPLPCDKETYKELTKESEWLHNQLRKAKDGEGREEMKARKKEIDDYLASPLEIRFVDTMAFLNSSMDTLLGNLPDECKERLRTMAMVDGQFDPTRFEMVKKKGGFPYEWFDHWSKLHATRLPSLKEWNSRLTRRTIDEATLQKYQQTWDYFGFASFKEWHDHYLKIDVLGLTDVFENFRAMCMETYGVDPSYYFTAPGMFNSALYKYTGARVELLSDVDMYNFFEGGIRGGLSVQANRYARANNKYMRSHDISQDTRYLLYADANNLYGWAMKEALPYRLFEWVDTQKTAEEWGAVVRDMRSYEAEWLERTNREFREAHHDDKFPDDWGEQTNGTRSPVAGMSFREASAVESYCSWVQRQSPHFSSPLHAFKRYLYGTRLAEDESVGLTLKVDLEYPLTLHDAHNDYPLAPEPLEVSDDELKLSKYAAKKLKGRQRTACRKLCATLHDKRAYTVHWRALKLYLELGLRITKVHRVVSYVEKPWMRKYIELNEGKRRHARNAFEKDFFKLGNNSVFGKQMENVRNRFRPLVWVTSADEFLKEARKPSYHGNCVKYSETLLSLQHRKTDVTLNKPIQVGQAVLDLSKVCMFDFHYNVMQRKFGAGLRLLMTDTDSLVYEIRSPDPNYDLYRDLASPELYDHFDFSDYPTTHPLHSAANAKVAGKFKDDKATLILEFVGIRAKMYSLQFASHEEVTAGSNVEQLVRQYEAGKVKKGFTADGTTIGVKTMAYLRPHGGELVEDPMELSAYESITSKGIKKSIAAAELRHHHFKECLLQNMAAPSVSIPSLRSVNHRVFMFDQEKVTLDPLDDKRHALENGLHTLAHGHCRIGSGCVDGFGR